MPARRLIVLVIAAFVSAALDAQSQAPTLATSVIARRATPATATIIAVDATGDTIGLGSGFFIRSDGVLVTNWHVLEGASSAIVVMASREQYRRVTVLDADSLADVAILKVPGYDVPILPTRSAIPAVGERVVAIGSPLGLSQTVSEGIVSATRVVGGRTLVQISAPISTGSSGGAVLDGSGFVFAVSTSTLEGGQQLNFAVPIRYVLGLLADARTQRPLSDVFARAGAAPRTSDRADASAALNPTRAARPKLSMSGTYFVEQTPTNAPATGLRQVGLLLAGNDAGILMLSLARDSVVTGRPSTFSVSVFRTNPEGTVVLHAGGVTYEGFQTEGGGLVADAIVEYTNVSVPVRLHAKPISIPLSSSTGLYTARLQTFFQTGASLGRDVIDWRGDMAVVTTGDSISISLLLRNAIGGTTGILGSTRLSTDGSFRLEAQGSLGKVILTGTVRAGVVDARWRDERGQGMFYHGSLSAERR